MKFRFVFVVVYLIIFSFAGYSQHFRADAGKDIEMTCLDKATLNASVLNWTPRFYHKYGFRAVIFADEQTGYAAGGGPYGSVFAKTSDGGETWREIIIPTIYAIYDLHFMNKDTGILVGGFESVREVILKTVDGGTTWDIINSSSDVRLNAVTFLNDSIGYAAGINSTILKTQDGGDTWIILEAPVGTYKDILVLDDNSLIFLDERGGIVITGDGGISFEKIEISIPFYFHAIGRGGNGLFITGDEGLLLYSEDLFNSYEIIETGIVSNLYDIEFTSPAQGFIAADRGIMLMTENGGQTWQRQETGYKGSLYALGTTESGRCFAGGALRGLTDKGELFEYNSMPDTLIYSWSPEMALSDPSVLRPVANPEMSVSYTLTINDKNGNTASDTVNVNIVTPYIFAGADTVTGKNESLRMHGVVQSGRWSKETTGSYVSFRATHFINQDTGFMVGMNHSAGAILRTTDGGRTWSNRIFNIEYSLDDVTFVNDSVGFVVGYRGTILKTIDCGKTWVKKNSNTTTGLSSVYFVNNHIGFAAGMDNLMLKTTNGGETWTRCSMPSWEDIHKVYFIDENHGFATSTFYWEAAFFETLDGGVHWQKKVVPDLITTFMDIYFVDQNTGYMLGGDLGLMVIMKTTDGGISWKYNRFISDNYTTYSSIVFTNEFTGYVSNVIGEIYKTFNGGLQWYRFMDTGYGIEDLSFTGKFHGIAAGSSGMYAMYQENPEVVTEWTPENGLIGGNTLHPLVTPHANTKYTLTAGVPGGCMISDDVNVIVTDASAIEEITDNSRISVFPNPSSGKVSVRLNSFKAPAILEVLSMQGVKMQEFILADYQNEVRFNNLPKGLYIVRVSNGVEVSCMKLVIN